MTTTPPSKKKLNEPALYVITATTLPMLTTALFAFCMAVIAFAGSIQGVATASTAPEWFRLIDIPFLLLAVGALTLLFSTTCCLNAQAWDYTLLTEDYRNIREIPSDKAYVDHCLTKHKAWHRRAVYAYRCGLVASLFGFAGVAWFPSKLTAIALGLTALGLVIHLAIDAIAAAQLAKISRARPPS